MRDPVLAFLRAPPTLARLLSFLPLSLVSFPSFSKLPIGVSSESLSAFLFFAGLGLDEDLDFFAGLGFGKRAPRGTSSSESESSRFAVAFFTSAGIRDPRGTSSSLSDIVARIMVRSVMVPVDQVAKFEQIGPIRAGFVFTDASRVRVGAGATRARRGVTRWQCALREAHRSVRDTGDAIGKTRSREAHGTLIARRAVRFTDDQSAFRLCTC